jgi:halimadienyl-diphosphate synthase
LRGKMSLYQSIHRLLQKVGTGRMMSTAYDTAWIARLSELGEPMGEQAMTWLRSHQLANGSWGANEPQYYHDRLICTLAAMVALARWGDRQDRIRLQRAKEALKTAIKGLPADPAGKTAGFEMIVPTLLAEAVALGLVQSQGLADMERFGRFREAKLALLPGRISRLVTVAFSVEMVGPDERQCLDVENLQESNASVAHSPSATAYFVLNVKQDPAALAYLRQVVVNGGAPNVAPFDVFEPAWTLWNLALTGPLDSELLALCQPHLDFLQAAWKPGLGIGHAANYTPTDGDNTAIVHEVLRRFDRPADLKALLSYEQDDHYRCFELEADPSISTNVHVLDALRQAGLRPEHPSVSRIVQFLFRTQTLRLFWSDKRHASPYYPTTHAVIACAGYLDWLVDDAVYWILGTQSPDGSWGYYIPSAEETAYCLQALVAWKRWGGQVPDDVLKRGAAWLAEHAEPPYPPLWIGKCLYCPELVVRAAVLSALMMTAQGE